MFNTALNASFSFQFMEERRPIDRVLALARGNGWNQTELATRLDVLPQHITNWKKRGIPAEILPKIADLFRQTVDDLIGRKSSGSYWPFSFDRALWDALPEERRLDIEGVVLQMIERTMHTDEGVAKKPKTGKPIKRDKDRSGDTLHRRSSRVTAQR